MRKSFLLGGAVIAGLLFTQAAQAARVGDAAMGAAAGALVGGPIGAIAGGAVGYTQGPRIAHGMFHHRRRYWDSRHHRWYRR